MTRQSAYQKLSAKDELEMFRRSIRLLPALVRRGAAPLDALAVAYNVTFLYLHTRRENRFITPKKLLKRLTLSEIASSCEDILNGVESGANHNWKEDFN